MIVDGGKENSSMPTEVEQGSQMDTDVLAQIPNDQDLGGNEVQKGTGVGIESIPLPEKGALDHGKRNSASQTLGLLQKPLKKGSVEKLQKEGRKPNKVKVKLIGETLVESGSIKTIDSHFSQPHK